MKDGRPVRVLESFGAPRETTNPYICQLARSLDAQPQCELLLFSFRTAIFGNYDVFHIHWPEVVYTGHSPLKSIVRETLTAMIAARIAITRKGLVRTWHNIAPHSDMNWRQRMLNRWLDHLTTGNIRLNEITEPASSAPTTTILHGHYRDWFAPYTAAAKIPGRVAFFGLIRQYKGVESLIGAFEKLQRPELSLTISGQPSTPELMESLIQLGSDNPNIEFTFAFLGDAQLVHTVTQAELVVLPYRFMHNSGAALTALSLNRPVVVPDTEVNRRLSAEVGPGWVYCFAGTMDAAVLESALSEHRANPPQHLPDLKARAWDQAGADHVRVLASAAVAYKVPNGAMPQAKLGTR